MTRDEKIILLTTLDNAIARCHDLAEKAETFAEKQYQWGQADGLQSASILIAGRPEKLNPVTEKSIERNTEES